MRRLPWLTATIATMLILIEWHGWLATEGLSPDNYHTYLTSAILHNGWSHCIINTTLLVLLGTFFEGFGHRRAFAILMALAALTTPIASVIVLGAAVPDGARGFSGVAASPNHVLPLRGPDHAPTPLPYYRRRPFRRPASPHSPSTSPTLAAGVRRFT